MAGDASHREKIDAALAEYEEKEDGYTRQFELLHDALANGAEPPVTIEDARRALELVTAGCAARRTGRPTTMPITKDHPLYDSWLP